MTAEPWVITAVCPTCGMTIRLTRRGLFTKHGGGIRVGVVQANRLLGLPSMQQARTGPCAQSGQPAPTVGATT